jgi:SAM-dependent methyltransferase
VAHLVRRDLLVSSSGNYHEIHLTYDPNRAVVWKVIADHLSKWIPQDAHVLEIGAGYCDWINAVRAGRKVAIDVWPEMPRHAAPNVDARILNATASLPSLGSATFDIVLASNVIEHFETDVASAIVANVVTLLKPGGRFIVIQPNFRFAYRQYFDDYTHRSIFTDVSLSSLMRNSGLTIDVLRRRFLPYSLRGTRLPVWPWLVRAYLHSPIKPLAGQMLIIGRKG